MIEEKDDTKVGVLEHETDSNQKGRKGPSRRQFLGQVGVAATFAAGALTLPSAASAQSTTSGVVPAVATPPGVSNARIVEAFTIRVTEATTDALLGPARNIDNGDDARYADKGGTYTKGLPHDSFGRVDLTAYALFKKALASGKFSDYAAVPLGGTRTENGPQGALAFDLEAPDNVQFGQPQVPPAPTIASDVSGTELLEHYWASLLRDTNFTDYGSSALAATAAAELTTMPSYLGPRTSSGQVTPALLFRGGFPGETVGPYLSQFFIEPTFFGAQPISQQMQSFVPNIDFGTNFAEWVEIQNGQDTGRQLQFDPVFRFRRNGRDLAAFTHVDVLYQAYFTTLLVLGTLGVPVNPGNPYIGSNQNGFGTFGGPDFAGILGEVATRALNAVWWQKWNIHLRPRPEVLGAFVHLVKTGQGNQTDVQPSPVVLNSVGLQQSFNRNGSWLLSQAFPEGSPTHPSYPTGHGTVGGACITALKFFFDGNFPILHPVVPSSDGLSLVPYTGPGANSMTVNGELNKLGHNVSFGHGIHAGIHWRSDTDTSLLLGEAVALSILRNKAKTYNEPFSVTITKFDGTTTTISNHGNP